MRNLKRALSLTLASIMLLGMMVVGSSAASYKDVTDDHNVEAIEVLQAVGIMVGDDGNFNPEKNVTRNEMAVIMSKLMDYRVASYAGTSPFTDVPSWAEPYVAACYTNGITSGTSATTYNGSGNVTTAQAALMILKALGYFQYTADFGDDWQLAATRQANSVDLLVDVKSGVKEAMTRNDVAQLVLNGLEAGTVEADTSNSVNVSVGGAQVSVGGTKYNFVTSGRDYAYAINRRLATTNNGEYSTGAIVELGEKLYQGALTKVESYDVFDRPANIWEYQAKEVGTYTDAESYSWTTKVTSKTLYNAVGKTATDNYRWNVSIDGVPQEYTGRTMNAYKTDDDKCFLQIAIDGLAATKRTGNGVLTQVYVDGTDRTVDVSVIHYYAAEVYKVTDGTLTLNKFEGDARLTDEFVSSDFEEDQVVVYSYANSEIREVFPTTRIEGEVDEVRTDTSDGLEGDRQGNRFVLDGEPYSYNRTVREGMRLQTENVGNKMVGYVDHYGFVTYIDEAAVTYDYAYVLSVGNNNDQYDSVDQLGATVYARLLFTDGSIARVETDIKASNAYVDGAWQDFNNDHNTTTTAQRLADAMARYRNHIVSYSKNSNNVYSLAVRDVTEEVRNGDGVLTGYTMQGTVADGALSAGLVTVAGVTDITKNGVSYVGAGTNSDKSSFTANDNTVFVVAEKDANSYEDYSISVYTGIKNIPDIKYIDANTKIDVAADKNGIAKMVYIQDADVSGTNSISFIKGATDANLYRNSKTGNWYAINAVVNGEIVELKVAENSSAADQLIKSLNVNTDGLKVGDTSCILAVENITYNADNLVTNIKPYAVSNRATDTDGWFSGTGTEKTDRGVVGLINTGRSSYGWAKDMPLVRYTYNGSFQLDTMGTVKDAANDTYLAIVDEHQLVGLLVREVRNYNAPGGEDDGSETTLPTTSDVLVNGTIGSGATMGRYLRSSNTLSLQFNAANGVIAGAAKVAFTGGLSITEYPSGTTHYVPETEYTIQKGTQTSYVAKVPMTIREDTSMITVNGGAVKNNSLYVTYDTSIADSVTYANMTETVANAINTEFTFTVKKPTGVASFGITDASSVNITAVTPAALTQAAQTADVAYTVKLTAAGTAPVIKMTQAVAGYTVNTPAPATSAYSLANGVTGAYFTTPSTTMAPTGGNVTLNLSLSAAATTDNQVVVKYTVGGVAQADVTHTCTAANTQAITLPTGALTGAAEVVVTDIEVQTKITMTSAITKTTNMTNAGTLAAKGWTATDWVAVGTPVQYEATIPGVTGDGTGFVLSDTVTPTAEQAVTDTTATNVKLTFSYTPVIGAVKTVTVTGTDK